jgi:hypothetical protein
MRNTITFITASELTGHVSLTSPELSSDLDRPNSYRWTRQGAIDKHWSVLALLGDPRTCRAIPTDV